MSYLSSAESFISSIPYDIRAPLLCDYTLEPRGFKVFTNAFSISEPYYLLFLVEVTSEQDTRGILTEGVYCPSGFVPDISLPVRVIAGREFYTCFFKELPDSVISGRFKSSWNWEMDDFLRKTYGSMSLHEQSKTLVKSVSSVKNRLVKLGLSTGRNKEWSVRETSFLISTYGSARVSDIAEVLNRSTKSVQRKAESLRLRKNYRSV